MNQTQRTYIRKRVGEILNDKMNKARQKFTTKAITLTNQERVDMMRTSNANN